MQAKIIQGDCLDVMAGMPEASIDAIVTDPPYGLSFMGKDWDKGVPGEAFWREALRIAKPGCHILAAGGSRTYHRLAVAIEDAGWEIRDCVMWIYGSGFPKSLDVSKAIDKADASEEQERRRLQFTAWVRSTGVTSRQIDDATGTNMGGHYTTAASQPAVMTREHLEKCRHLIGEVPAWVEQECDIRSVESRNFAEREVVGHGSSAISTRKELKNSRGTVWGADSSTFSITAPATDAAKQWQGWGTALKPAFEPFILARKPLDGTVAANVQRHGCGGLNVDGCRVGSEVIKTCAKPKGSSFTSVGNSQGFNGCGQNEHEGRWPANVIHDGSDETTHLFCSAARFFYCAKASRSERGEQNHHPTVKPVELMAYLCRLITPPDGMILDPFCGSGSTGVAAMREGFNFTGIELNPEYVEIAKRRISHEREKVALLA